MFSLCVGQFTTISVHCVEQSRYQNTYSREYGNIVWEFGSPAARGLEPPEAEVRAALPKRRRNLGRDSIHPIWVPVSNLYLNRHWFCCQFVLVKLVNKSLVANGEHEQHGPRQCLKRERTFEEWTLLDLNLRNRNAWGSCLTLTMGELLAITDPRGVVSLPTLLVLRTTIFNL